MKRGATKAITSAFLAAVFYAISVPMSKILLQYVGPTMMAALLVMIAGLALVVADTLIRQHAHLHQHTFAHTHDGTTHTHTVTHSHDHNHYVTDNVHGHRHTLKELEQLPGAAHY